MPIQPRATSAEAAAFMALYRQHLAAPDCPSGRIAYQRAEAEAKHQTGKHRYRNYEVFRSAMSHFQRRERANRRRRQIVDARRAGC
jgi:DNA gyrase/topoisomerase IV subunit A